MVVDVDTDGINGHAPEASIFNSVDYNGGEFGTVSGGALLNVDASSSSHSEMLFSFSIPIRGFGAWIFDDTAGDDQIFRLRVTEVGGVEYVSPLLNSSNGPASVFVEGFLGVSSDVGGSKRVI